MLAETWRELDVDHSAEEGLDTAAEFVDQVLTKRGSTADRVIGVAMGLPAPIDRATGAVQAASILPGWVGVDAAAEASARLGMPVQVENDANLGALAELVWGAAKGKSEVAYIKVAAGIGGGADLGRRAASRRRRDRGRDRPHAGRRGRAGLPLRQPRLPGDARLLARDRQAAQREPREEISSRRLLELCNAGDAAAQRLMGDAGRAIGDRGREPLQPAEPRMRDRRR